MPKVMLIEDDLTLVGLLRTLLEIEGFTISIAERSDLDHIPQLIHADQPEVVLMDVHMRSVNGLEILRAIRQDPGLTRVRVIMTSGIDLGEQCLATGADGFMLKPYFPDALVKMIRENISSV
jgi:two-component system nitrate/nitrite response regulator NarP